MCVLSPNVLKSFYSFQEIETIRPCVYVVLGTHYTVMKWFHEISGCDIVVYGCSPIAVEHSTKCCYLKLLIYIPINPHISLVSVLKKC